MNRHFIERLIDRARAQESAVSIKPARTPNIVHDVFHLPEPRSPSSPLLSSPRSALFPLSHLQPSPSQEHVFQPAKPRALSSSARSANEANGSRPFSREGTDIVDEVSMSNQMPEPRGITPLTGEASDAPVPQPVVPRKTDERTRTANVLSVKREELNDLTEEQSTETARIKKKEEGAVKIGYGTGLNAPKEGEPVRTWKEEKALSGDDAKTRPTDETLRGKGPQLSPFSPGDLPKPQLEVGVPAELVTRVEAPSPVVSPQTALSLPARERRDRSQGYTEPTVTIHIGRIEVHALMPEKPSTEARIPVLSLKEYLKQRSEGSR